MPFSPATALGRIAGPDFFTICGRAVKPNYLKVSYPCVARWIGHDARGLIRPTTKKGKQKLLSQIRDLYDQGKEYKKIGAVVGLYARSVKPLPKIILLLWVFKYLMADQGNDLGIENLDVLKRRTPASFLAIRDEK